MSLKGCGATLIIRAAVSASEEEDLRLRLFVGGEDDIPFLDYRDCVAPLSPEIQNRTQRAIDVLRRFPPVHLAADSGDERLVLAEIHFA
jgi:hypothetical protein